VLESVEKSLCILFCHSVLSICIMLRTNDLITNTVLGLQVCTVIRAIAAWVNYRKPVSGRLSWRRMLLF